MITLSDDERHKFVAWLEHEAASCESAANLAETQLTGMAPFIQHKRIQAAACKMVARMMGNVEQVTIMSSKS